MRHYCKAVSVPGDKAPAAGKRKSKVLLEWLGVPAAGAASGASTDRRETEWKGTAKAAEQRLAI